jgi:2-haloacid dehalogenase
MPQINTIIFDLGGVLIDWNPLYVFNEVIPDPEKRKFFFDNVCTSEWNEEQDAGRNIADANALKIAEFPEWETEIRAYYDRWVEMLGEPLHGTVEILRKAIDNPNYRVYALTNWSGETFPIAQGMERFQFLHWFEGIVVSGDEKTRKPFPKIYQILLDRYGVNPAEAVFIDDNFKNIVTARELGIAGIHFQSSEQLAEELEGLGVGL